MDISCSKDDIDQGSYGTIYTTSREDVVCKVNKHSSNGLSEAFLRETSSLMYLNGITNVVDVISIKSDDKKGEIYMKKYEESLHNILSHIKDSPEQIKRVIYEVLSILSVAHRHHVINGDVKPSNILLDKQGSVFICDWGLSLYRLSNSPTDHVIQTISHRSPEVLCHMYPYTNKVDVWGVGIVMCELLLGKMFFSYNVADIGEENEHKQLLKIFNSIGYPNPETDSKWCTYYTLDQNTPIRDGYKNIGKILGVNDCNCLDLIDQMLQYNPSDRISCEMALKHPYFWNTGVAYLCINPKPLEKKEVVSDASVGISVTISDRIKVLKHSLRILTDHRMPNNIYFMGCVYFDEYLSKNIVKIDDLFAVCMCCMMLSSKVNDYMCMSMHKMLSDMIFCDAIMSHTTTKSMLINIELSIAQCLDFSLYCQTIYHCINSRMGDYRFTKEQKSYILRLCYKLTFNQDMYKYSFEELAESVLQICNGGEITVGSEVINFVRHCSEIN